MEYQYNRQGEESEGSWSMYSWYIAFLVISQILFIILGVKWIKLILTELRGIFVDEYKLAQLSLILGFIFFRSLFEYLCLIHSFKFHYIPVSLFIMIWFYFLININSLCWVNFLLHIDSWDYTKRYTIEDMNKVKAKEWWIKIITLVAFWTLFAIALFLNIYSGIINCFIYNPFKEDGIDDIVCSRLDILAKILSYILLFFGTLSAIVKLIVGVTMLQKMKTKFIGVYNKLKKPIMLTTTLTTLIILLNVLFNMTEDIKFTDFSIYIVLNEAEVPAYSYFKALISMINLASEISLMYFNVTLIDFKNSIIKLMEGRQKLELVPKMSIFIWLNKNSHEYTYHLRLLSPNKQYSDPREEEKSTDSFLSSAGCITDQEEFISRKYWENYESKMKVLSNSMINFSSDFIKLNASENNIENT